MRKFLASRAVKTTAVIMSSLLAVLFVLSLGGISLLWENRAYSLGKHQNTVFFENLAMDRGDDLLWDYIHHKFDYPDDTSQLEEYADCFSRQNSNYFFTVTDMNGQIILSNKTDEAVRRTVEYVYTVDDPYSQQDINIKITQGLYSKLSANDDTRFLLSFGDWLYSARYGLIAVIALSALGELLILIFVCLSAGRGPRDNIGFFDRIPYELYGLAVLLLMAVTDNIINDFYYSDIPTVIFWVAITTLGMPVLCLLLHTTAVRIKTHTFIKNTLIYRAFKLIKMFCVFLWRIIKKIPFIWKTATLWAGLAFTEIFFILASDGDALFVIWILDKLLLTLALLWILLCMLRLQRSAREISEGNIEYKVDTQYMLPAFKEHGENLNGIADGLRKSVAQSIKSERMKAELITNVSHDIKTPLTSIINYVDLLDKDGLTGQDAPQYLEVLKRQSARLKKLTEDLIEASKASTGNIKADIKNVDIEVLLLQAIGEYSEKLDAKQLSVITSFCQDKEIFADGKLLWRVLDNLFSNICKYSKNDTRVYISVRNTDDRITVTFKNISADPLDISADELAERFVRGDTSRNTEGSGLGLSIARSLIEIQGGTMDIDIDGDLFKTIITFKKTS